MQLIAVPNRPVARPSSPVRRLLPTLLLRQALSTAVVFSGYLHLLKDSLRAEPHHDIRILGHGPAEREICATAANPAQGGGGEFPDFGFRVIRQRLTKSFHTALGAYSTQCGGGGGSNGGTTALEERTIQDIYRGRVSDASQPLSDSDPDTLFLFRFQHTTKERCRAGITDSS